nr:MAG TPA: hypothetical protein [Caudoviricetes sp.]
MALYAGHCWPYRLSVESPKNLLLLLVIWDTIES